ncbi:MAG TPA: recombinase family protein [Ktedonobacterales bacterium]|jgi:DNA invertase Pin-like site-specific DNA recombinase
MTNAQRTSDNVCVVYCRVSSDKQAREEKGSLDAQERNGLAKAQELRLQVLYVVKDAESAWILDKRTKFQNVLEDARAGKFSVLIVDRMNRFTRSEDMGEYMQVMTELRRAGISLKFADREYEDTKTGQLMQFLDAYVSAGEQEARRKQSLQGKRNKVMQLGRPNPGSWPLYGYVWVDDKKTCLDFDPGQSQQIVRRIWHHFLTADHPTLAGMAKTLNREQVKTPREYRNVARGSNALAIGPRWTAVTIGDILNDARYWGGDENGMVPTFRYSRHSDQTLVPAYAPAYVTREDAARVHARLEANKKYAYRHRKHTPNTLLYGGLARCGYCGWALAPHPERHPRVDGTTLIRYRCMQSNAHGVKDCKGVGISAEVLDNAVQATLHYQIQRGYFLERIFEDWERDAESAMGQVRTIEQTIKETKEQIQNAMARLNTYAPGDPLAAPLEAHARMLAETVSGLEKRHDEALAALNRARGNPDLARSLRQWFDAWLSGAAMLSNEQQREFLKAIKAEVHVWRKGDHTPQAQLVIALPSSALHLPPPPTTAEDNDGRHFDLDLEEGAELAEIERNLQTLQLARYNGASAVSPRDDDPEAVMSEIVEELTKQGMRELAARRLASSIVKSPPRHPRTAEAAAR